VVAGCGKWIALAAGLELLSMSGFILVFALVFGAPLGWRQRLGAGLRALGASALLPGGGLVGPAIGARTASGDAPMTLIRSTTAFTIITNAPSAIVLGALGLALWLGWPSGPHSAGLTLPAAGLGWGVLAAAWFVGRSSSRSRSRRRLRSAPWRQIAVALSVLRGGADNARRIVAARNWKLLGAVGYYAFDNAVLWAAFRAYGQAPPISVIVMGYLVGSLGGLVPLPAGIGAIEGGLIGALVLYGAPAAPAAGAVLLYRGLSLSLQVTLSAMAWALVPAARPRDRSTRRPRGVVASLKRRSAEVPSHVA
jgi:uncharacterized membrane protein YbhN (UPF0104 family)